MQIAIGLVSIKTPYANRRTIVIERRGVKRGSMSGFIHSDRFRKLLLALPQKAIALLYERYYDALVSISDGLVHDRKAAEDIVQETFIHVWEKHRKLGQPDRRSIEHYLVKVVRNKSISWYKESLRHRTYRFVAVREGMLVNEAASVESQWIGKEMSDEIRMFIATFPRRETECLLLRIDEALTTQQIANRLNVSRKAVERSLTSANKRLRKYLRGQGYRRSGRRKKLR